MPKSCLTPADALSQTKAIGLLGSFCKHESLLWQQPDVDLLYSLFSDSMFSKEPTAEKLFDPRDDWTES